MGAEYSIGFNSVSERQPKPYGLASATFFKIDYYDHTLSHHSSDPADPVVIERVITIMLAEVTHEVAHRGAVPEANAFRTSD